MTLPTIDEELVSLKTHVAWADWLVRQSDGVFASYAASIRRRLDETGFVEALTFLKARIAAVWSDRGRDGSLPQTVLMGLHYSMGVMVDAARARDGGVQ